MNEQTEKPWFDTKTMLVRLAIDLHQNTSVTNVAVQYEKSRSHHSIASKLNQESNEWLRPAYPSFAMGKAELASLLC